jgi:fructose-1,6-bisphosphatase/inositol monophosphatase family enzyme
MVPIVAGAGGIATDWRGADLDIASDGRILVAGDHRTHRTALELIGG